MHHIRIRMIHDLVHLDLDMATYGTACCLYVQSGDRVDPPQLYDELQLGMSASCALYQVQSMFKILLNEGDDVLSIILHPSDMIVVYTAVP